MQELHETWRLRILSALLGLTLVGLAVAMLVVQRSARRMGEREVGLAGA